MMKLRFGIALGLACLLQACAADRPVGLGLGVYGEAVRANIAVQTVNPMAPADRGPILADGQRTALQQERYVTDQVEPPEEVGTLQGAGGGGGAGGRGAGGAAAGVGAAVQ